MSEEAVAAALVAFIRERFLDGDRSGELTEESPLLEWGILDSLKTAVLLTFIRDELGVMIPAVQVDARNFRDVRSIAAAVVRTAAATKASAAEGMAR
jgi:acyl carrier protein